MADYEVKPRPSFPGLSVGVIALCAGLTSLIVLAFIGNHRLELVSIFGRLSLLGGCAGFVVIALLIIAKNPLVSKRVAVIVFFIFVLSLVYGSSALIGENPQRALIRAGQLLFIVCAIFVCFRVGSSHRGELFSSITGAVALVAMLALIISVAAGGVYLQSTAGLNNPNALGMAGFTLLFFCLLLLQTVSRRARLPLAALFFLLCTIIVVSSSSRATLAAFLVSGAVYSGWKFISQSRICYWAFILTLCGLCAAAVPVLSGWMPAQLFEGLNHLSHEYFGKELMSGRDQVWPALIGAIADKPLLGWGGGVLVEDANVNGWSLSAHNLYLQVTLQIGLLGFAILILAFLVVWNSIWYAQQTMMGRILGAYFSGMLVLQTFEVTLTQNNLAFGLPFWCLFGALIGMASRAWNVDSL